MSATDPVSPTSEGEPRRIVKAANQGRWRDWIAGFLAASLALILLLIGIELIAESRLASLTNVAALPFVAALALWTWVNRAELELSPEQIVIRSRWRRVMRARPRDLVLPAEAAIVAEKGLVRVGGWSAGIWSPKRIAALTEEGGVPLDVRQQQTPKQVRTRRLVALAVMVPLTIVEIVWVRTWSISFVEMILSVLWGLGSLTFLAMLWLRFRAERAVPGDAIEPIRGPV
jgi:hypothetical protein